MLTRWSMRDEFASGLIDISLEFDQVTIDRDRRALKYIDDISADQQIPVYFFLLQAFRYLVLLLLVSRSRTTFVPFNGESVLPEPIIPPSISFPALVTDSSTHHQTPSTSSKNGAPPTFLPWGSNYPNLLSTTTSTHSIIYSSSFLKLLLERSRLLV